MIYSSIFSIFYLINNYLWWEEYDKMAKMCFEVVGINMTNQLLFTNVTKLTVKHFIDNDYYFMSKFKFPKLETLSIIKKNNFNIPTDQFKHIKSFYLESYSIIPELILQLNQLTDFVWKCICTYYAQK